MSREYRFPYQDHYDCSVCLEECIDPLEKRALKVNGNDVCSKCVKICEDCGNPIDDTTAHLGPLVRLRQPECNGRLGDLHAICAADRFATEKEAAAA